MMKSLIAQLAFIILCYLLGSYDSLSVPPDSLLIDDLAKLPLDSNGRLGNNWFLYQDTPDCKNAFKTVELEMGSDFRQIAACSSSIIEIFFGDAKANCSAISFIKGTNPDLFTHVLPSHLLIAADVNIEDDVTAWVIGMTHS